MTDENSPLPGSLWTVRIGGRLAGVFISACEAADFADEESGQVGRRLDDTDAIRALLREARLEGLVSDFCLGD